MQQICEKLLVARVSMVENFCLRVTQQRCWGDPVASSRYPVVNHQAPTSESREMPIYNWMRGLKNDRKLKELCLPGSHDAGVYKDKQAGIKPGSSTRTQYSPIYNQAMHGSRVFDVRCFLRTTGVFKKTKTVTMGTSSRKARMAPLAITGAR